MRVCVQLWVTNIRIYITYGSWLSREEWDSVSLPCYEARVGFEGMQIGIERAYSNVFLRRVVSEKGRGISDYQDAS